PERAIDYVKQVCVGLGYAHAQKVIHRDIKPANLMVNRQEMIKITDFGIARIAKDSMTRMASKDTSGTTLYMAPEQLRGNGVDGRGDIYSLGATMYELLSGRPPFHSGGIEYQILHEPPEPIAGLPERINEILLKALAKDKEQRWPSARALLEALEGRIEVDCD